MRPRQASVSASERSGLLRAVGNEAHTSWICNDDLVSKVNEEPTYPGRVGAHLENNTRGRHGREPLTNGCRSRAKSAFFDNLTFAVNYAKAGVVIREVEPNSSG